MMNQGDLDKGTEFFIHLKDIQIKYIKSKLQALNCPNPDEKITKILQEIDLRLKNDERILQDHKRLHELLNIGKIYPD